MKRVLLIGYDADSVDYKDPALPSGMTAEKIIAGIQFAMKDMRDRGWEADHLSIQPDATAGRLVEEHLASNTYDCIVIGGGIRMSAEHVHEFEAVINAVHKGAPRTSIAFNTTPVDSAEAAARCIEPQ